MELGFTRGYLSSQAYMEKWGKDPSFSPTPKSLDYDYAPYEEKYQWLGFHARKLMIEFVDECVKDPRSTLDLFAYDIDEPYIVKQLEALKGRLRAVLFTGEHPVYLRHPPAAGQEYLDGTHVEAPWWPPHKIAGHHLGPYLASHADLLVPMAHDG